MTDIRKNIRFLIFVFVLLFAATVFYLIYNTTIYGERWFADPHNPRINNVRSDIAAGTITDRAGTKLAWTDGDDREYAEDSSLRKAVSHVVGDRIGMTRGAETLFSKYLYGFSEDAVDRITDVIQGKKRKGGDISLTIDAKLSDYILQSMGSKKGAVVLLNYKTGEILASVSNPGFDPDKIKSYTGKSDSTALFDRAMMGRYPPGSIFKVITSAAVLDNPELQLKGFTCTGSIMVGGNKISCASGEVHGKEDLDSAFYESCNAFFATQALKLGAEKMYEETAKFSFNDDFLFDDVITYKSIYEKPTNDVDLAWSGVGQFNDLVTPLHAAMIAGTVANGGVMMEPRMLKSASTASGKALYSMTPKAYKTPVSGAVADKLKDMMFGVVREGTGTAAKVSGLKIGGKTGTAQYTDTKGKTKEHAWFIGFVNDAKHPLAIAVLLEGAGSGGRNSAPIASKTFKKAVDLGY